MGLTARKGRVVQKGVLHSALLTYINYGMLILIMSSEKPSFFRHDNLKNDSKIPRKPLFIPLEKASQTAFLAPKIAVFARDFKI